MDNFLKEVSFSQLSNLKYDIFLFESSVKSFFEIMIIKFTGQYGFGSGGNSDAVFMKAISKAALSAWVPKGLILDFTNLEYEWGDQIEILFDLNPFSRSPFPLALIVGEKSEEGVRTLILGCESTESIDQVDWVFKDFGSAREYIENKVKEYYS